MPDLSPGQHCSHTHCTGCPTLCMLCRAWAEALLAAVAAVRSTAPLQPAALATLCKCSCLRSLSVGTLRSIHREVQVSLGDVAGLSRLQHLQLDPCLVSFLIWLRLRMPCP